jgi:hypothetical protein
MRTFDTHMVSCARIKGAGDMEREVPEADALDQEREAFPHDEDMEPVPDDPEVPEADAIEQAQPAPVDEDEFDE